MLSHAAFICSDTSKMVAFHSGLLGMELVAAVLDDTIPSTGEPIPYFHSFFRMGGGSTHRVLRGAGTFRHPASTPTRLMAFSSIAGLSGEDGAADER